MNRIPEIFRQLSVQGKKALICYLSAGCPALEESERLIHAVVENGADIIELGVPFSDPTADGPAIQAASQTAIQNGSTLPHVLELAGRFRSRYPGLGIVLFSYYNPVFRFGAEAFAEAAQKQGIDAVLIVDLPYEEAQELDVFLQPRGIARIPLVSPETSPERARKIIADAAADPVSGEEKNRGGFVYCITVRGVTGERSGLPEDLKQRLETLKKLSPLPVAAGFGISDYGTARASAESADGIIVGSSFVKIQNSSLPEEEKIRRISEWTALLSSARTF